MAYENGGTVQRARWDFVSTFDLHKEDHGDFLIQPYGSQLLTGLMELMGRKKVTDSVEFFHHEEDRIMPKIKAHNGGVAGGASASDSLTLDAAALSAPVAASPHIHTSPTQYAVPRAGDILHFLPASGTAGAGDYVEALVTAVQASAGTFDCTPMITGQAIPAIAAVSPQEIIIVGNAFEEGSNQPASRQSSIRKVTNNTQIMKERFDITGTEDAVVLWIPVVDPVTGKRGAKWTIKGERDTYLRFLNYRELQMLLGVKTTNATLANNYKDGFKTTDGLINFCLGGVNLSYNSISGITLNDFENLVVDLDKQKGAKENILKCGINLSLDIDREMRDSFKEGAVTYGAFAGLEDKMVSLQFDDFKVGNYLFHKRTYEPFNDLQTMGADGYGYSYEGMLIPMDSKVDAKSRDKVPSFCTRHLEGREMRVNFKDHFQESENGGDYFSVDYLSEIGFQAYGQNRFGYISRA